MKITKKSLQNALREAKRKDSYIYVVNTTAEGVEIWVNSATPDIIRQGTEVIKVLDYGEIENDYIYYKDGFYTMDEFCSMINSRY